MYQIDRMSDLSEGAIADLVADMGQQIIHPANSDVSVALPSSIPRQRVSEEIIQQCFVELRTRLQPGVHEEIIAHQDGSVIAMGRLVLADYIPRDVSPNTPMVSAFVFKPWRRLGVASHLLGTMLEESHKNFNGQAWAMINQANHGSIAVVKQAGFKELAQRIGTDGTGKSFHYEPLKGTT